MLNHPLLSFLPLMLFLWLTARVGVYLRRRLPLKDDERADFGFVQAATLTLLGLIIGFSFSMAIGRYDQRKNYEEAEANAIGTEYVRSQLLPGTDAERVRSLLRKYLQQRILFYRTREQSELLQINTATARLQDEMWSAVRLPAATEPTPVITLVVSGMNDVLNSQGYTQAAWWNRIPTSAWGLMIAIAVFCNLMVGYGGSSAKARASVIFILPLVVSISFLLIADIDSPRGGLIRVSPRNLVSLSQSFPS